MARQLDIDREVLRAEIAAAYGVELDGALFRSGSADDAARVRLADRLAAAIEAAGPRRPAAAPARPLADWQPLPVAPFATSDPAAATAQLLAWARAGGVDLAAVEIRTAADGYRTAHASRAVATGERILHMPRALLFDGEAAGRSPVGRAIAATGVALASEHTVTASALLAERRRAGSTWQPYLDALPGRFLAMPVFQAVEALLPLVGSSALDRVRDVCRAVRIDHAALASRLAPSLGSLDLAELAWARAICASRTFKITVHGVDGSALVPIADLFDHGTGDAHWHYDDASEGLLITAARDLAAGEPIRLSYGSKSNARLLASYGFCLPDNPADVAQVSLPRDPADARGELIARLLWERPLGAASAVQVSRRFDDDTVQALSQARIAVADDRELWMALDRRRIRGGHASWLGERNELAAWDALAAAAHARLTELARMASTPASAAPPAEPAAPYARAVALLLAGERQVLEALIGSVTELRPRLARANRWDLRRHAGNRGDLVGGYLRKLADELA